SKSPAALANRSSDSTWMIVALAPYYIATTRKGRMTKLGARTDKVENEVQNIERALQTEWSLVYRRRGLLTVAVLDGVGGGSLGREAAAARVGRSGVLGPGGGRGLVVWSKRLARDGR
ncbi:hypothetical protein U9M48_026034, partial [Paspalum notatum var. saurae]